MFEFDRFEAPADAATHPAVPYIPVPSPAAKAFLLWSEHCVECAAPDCYASCDLYEARSDGRCRRFVHGAYCNPAFPCSAGFGAEIRFKRWGKLEARGNVRLFPVNRVRLMEQVGALSARVIDPVGRAVARVSGDVRWKHVFFTLSERANEKLRSMGPSDALPDAFLAEIYNPTESPIDVSFTVSALRPAGGRFLGAEKLPTPYSTRLTLTPGHNVHRIPFVLLSTVVHSGLPFSLALTPLVEGAHLVFLTLDFVSDTPLGMAAPSEVSELAQTSTNEVAAKCVVFDLDNTLWRGILVEGRVTLRTEIPHLFSELDSRGILISVASKNAPEDALSKLEELGLEEFVVFPSIGWGPKSAGVRQIAQLIDIGVDTLILVDDSPFERAEVSGQLPEVEVLPETQISRLLDHPRLKGSQTEEARTRRQMYRHNMRRVAEQVTFGEDYLAFLRSCEIAVEIRPHRADEIDRIYELVQRTNQLNFSGHKYSRTEILPWLSNPEVERYVIRVLDRFGEYGLVGFCLATRSGDRVIVKDFMLSCRVQGKFIEQAVLGHLVARPDKPTSVVEVCFVRTARNGPAEAVLRKLGFDVSPGESAVLRVPEDRFVVNFMQVQSEWS